MADQILMPEFVDLIHANVPLERVHGIVDAGSYDGADCLTLKRAFPWAHAIAIEGDPVAFNPLALRAAGIEPVQAVLDSEPQSRTWYRQVCAPKISGYYNRELPEAQAYQVATTTLAAVLDASGLSKPSIVKVDCEGATMEALRGLGAYLFAVEALHLETETESFFAGQRYFEAAVFAWVEAHGFRCIGRSDGEGQHDSVWVRT